MKLSINPRVHLYKHMNSHFKHFLAQFFLKLSTTSISFKPNTTKVKPTPAWHYYYLHKVKMCKFRSQYYVGQINIIPLIFWLLKSALSHWLHCTKTSTLYSLQYMGYTCLKIQTHWSIGHWSGQWDAEGRPTGVIRLVSQLSLTHRYLGNRSICYL